VPVSRARRCGGALTNGTAAGARRHGPPVEHEGGSGVAACKVEVSGAYPSDATSGRRRLWVATAATEAAAGLQWPERAAAGSCSKGGQRGR
jgi:hypothetical protein